MMDSKYSPDMIKKAHDATFHNEKIINASNVCICCHCGYEFDPKDEPELYWMDETSPEGRTLACPMCIVDSILGDATGLPIHEHAFIEACSMDWFDSCVALNEWGPNLLATPITIIVE